MPKGLIGHDRQKFGLAPTFRSSCSSIGQRVYFRRRGADEPRSVMRGPGKSTRWRVAPRKLALNAPPGPPEQAIRLCTHQILAGQGSLVGQPTGERSNEVLPTFCGQGPSASQPSHTVVVGSWTLNLRLQHPPRDVRPNLTASRQPSTGLPSARVPLR